MLDDRAARRLLWTLADGLGHGRGATRLPDGLPIGPATGWLQRLDLTAPAYALFGSRVPELAAVLRAQALSVAATNAALRDALERIERRFEERGIEFALLKGAAVAESLWGGWDVRPMADLDLWVRRPDLTEAACRLAESGFERAPESSRRPLALELLCGGEIQFLDAGRARGLVELHGSAFPGLWLRRTAAVDEDAVWGRTRPVGAGRHARRLAAEDEVLQIACHLVVGQLGRGPLRGLLDLALLARSGQVDWPTLVTRARAWRIATALWMVLDLAATLFGAPGAEAAIAELAPPSPRRASLRALVAPARVLAGRALRGPGARRTFLLLVVDRPRDVARLVARTVWPECWWLAGRYGPRGSHLHHLWHLARHGDA